MRGLPYRTSFYFLFICYAAGLLWGLCADGGRWAAWLYREGTLYGLAGLTCLAMGVLCFGRRPVWRVVAAVVLTVGCGYANVSLSRAVAGRLPEVCVDGGKRIYDVEVLDFGKETAKSWKKTVRVWAYADADGTWQAARAKLCLYFQKDSAAAALAPGDRLAVRVAPSPIDTAGYAGYARYMHRQNIYARAYVPRSGWVFASAALDAATDGGAGRHAAHRLRRAAGRLQTRLTAGLDHPLLTGRERGIAKALVFGDKSDMDPEISEAYRHAGVVHVLCVSGMHLGIVSCVLMLLLKGLGGRRGRWLRFGIVCGFLWGYALVTGLSASVCRAACMFTFVQAGLCLGRRLPVERSLLLSAWLLLTLRPDWLLDLGFLLSYIAVGGIVFLMPRVYPAAVEKRKVVKKMVEMSAVSWAAQCATAPLSLCFFGQFPVYFWVANMVIAPVASVLLPVGLVGGLLGLSVVGNGWLTTVLMTVLHYGLALMNGMSLWIERWPGAVWPLVLSGVACVCCYGILYCGRQAVVKREKRYLPYAGGLVWLVCCLA